MKNLQDLGRRIERLLIFAGPIAFLCCVFLLVSYSTSTQEENKISSQLILASDRLANKIKELETKYQAIRGAGSSSMKELRTEIYFNSVRYTVLFDELNTISDISGRNFSSLNQTIPPRLKALGLRSPAEIITAFTDEAHELRKNKKLVFGIQLPEKAKISVLGTDFVIQSDVYVTLMQITLAPVLILWLGSIYVTRLREVILIHSAKHLSLLFPHLINLYPVGKILELRKRSWAAYYSRYLVYFLFSMIRICALLVFIGPAVGPYLLGSYLQFNIDNNIYPLVLAGIVAFIALFSVFVELIPAHFTKSFFHDVPLGKSI
jgi:hypothetical protein